MWGFSMWLREKVEEAIEFLRKNEGEDGYVVKFSGGKDSIVTLDLVRRAGVRYRARYNFTGLEPPEVLRFMREEYSEVEWVRPKHTFWYWVRKVGPPTKARRWCCTKLKHAAVRDEKGCKIVVGVRAEESYKRRNRGRVSWNADGKNWVYAPIFYFTEADVWEYIEERGLRYPSLYDEGFERIACVVCPFLCGHDELLRRHRERWPGFYRAFERVVKEYFEGRREWFRSMGVESVEEYLERWYSNRPLVDGREEEEGMEQYQGVLFR
ncbi:MAG: phosphoadenosine phosphosulfate reductase family protein [Nanopusillaceae archaeon]